MVSSMETKSSSAASSPPAIAPAAATYQRQQSICIKPVIPSASSPAPSPQVQTSVTSKEWVIPPRPKPGRKPATDTPPTKRKAQNRAAQRAFRERRAARVGELEEQLKLIEEEDEREQNNLRDQIAELNSDLDQCRTQMSMWMERSHGLEKDLAEERHQREAIVRELENLQSTQPTFHAPSSSSNPSNTSHEQEDLQVNDRPIGCGGCSADSRCECVESAIDMSNTSDHGSSLVPKRPHSPQQQASEKRVKAEPMDETMEVDFTHSFTRPSKPHDTSLRSVIADPCGFCQDGTPCICAEMAADHPAPEGRPAEYRAPAPALSARQLAHFTPPPSEGDVAPLTANVFSDSCKNGAGSCTQCQADPNSTLFCKTLAAARARSMGLTSSAPPGCCGGAQNGQSCCQSQSRTLPPPVRAAPRQAATSPMQRDGQSPSSSITLSCADAYTTLSRHPGYERAITSGDVGSWMPKLYASPSRDVNGFENKKHQTIEANARPAMEIEVANVMSVLREFDRRFGSSA